MEKPEGTITWRCWENNREKQKLLENFLPEGYSYIVKSFSIIEENEIRAETKFQSRFSVQVCTEEGKNKWMDNLEFTTNTNYNINYGDNKKSAPFLVSGRRKCIFNVRKKKPLQPDKWKHKNTDCESSVKFQLKKPPPEHDHSTGPCLV